MRFDSRLGRVAGVLACLASARVAAAQTPPTDAAPAPPDETSSSSLPPLPPPARENDADTAVKVDTAPPADRTQAAAPHPGADTLEDTSDEEPALPDPWDLRPIVVEAQFGAGTPIGIAGLAIDYSPVPILGLNVGVGLGLGGVEYAFGSRLRVVRAGRRTHVAVYLGGGVSGGAYNTEYAGPNIAVDGSQGDFESPVPHYHWDAAFWTNLEAGVEIRFKSNFSLRPFAGAAYLLNPNAGVAVIGQHGDAPAPPERWLPYLGLAIGYAVRPW